MRGLGRKPTNNWLEQFTFGVSALSRRLPEAEPKDLLSELVTFSDGAPCLPPLADVGMKFQPGCPTSRPFFGLTWGSSLPIRSRRAYSETSSAAVGT
jgi:hypothetical protein